MLCFSVVSWLQRFAKVGSKSEVVRRIESPRSLQICTTPARESDLEVEIVHAYARERFRISNR